MGLVNKTSMFVCACVGESRFDIGSTEVGGAGVPLQMWAGLK